MKLRRDYMRSVLLCSIFGVLALGYSPLQGARAALQVSSSATIRANDWEQRRHAFSVIIGVEPDRYAAGGIPDVGALVYRVLTPQSSPMADQRKRALIELLGIENTAVAAKEAVRQQRGVDELPFDERLTEAYVTYYGDVIAAVAALRDARSVHALIGAITTGGMATDALIALGTAAVEPVAERVTDSDSSVRTSAARTLSAMLARSSEVATSAKHRSIIRSALLIAARDDYYQVRAQAVAGLARLGDTESIEIVRELASYDSYFDTLPGRVGRYPVREAATSALKAR